MSSRAPKSTAIIDSSKLTGPEKAAVVLLALGEDHAGVWRQLDEEEIKVISQAMAGLGQVTSSVVEDLLVEFVSGMGGGAITGSVELTQKLLASIMPGEKADSFNAFDRQTETRFITALEERNRESAERIRALMFVFEDLSKLDPGGVQTLLRTVEKDQLALALKGASDALREMFFGNMSERAAKIMREDMESMGPVRLREVEQAQMAMVQVAKDLANKGEIVLVGAGGDDDELVY